MPKGREERGAQHRSAVNKLAYVLELIGSFVYIIAAIFTVASFSGHAPQPGLLGLGSASIWFPFFYSAAIVGTVLLFIVSFSNLMHTRSILAHRYGLAVAVLAGLAWIGLAAGSEFLSIIVIFGFVASVVGGAYGMVDLLDRE